MVNRLLNKYLCWEKTDSFNRKHKKKPARKFHASPKQLLSKSEIAHKKTLMARANFTKALAP